MGQLEAFHREILKNGKLGYLCKVNDPVDLAEKIKFSAVNRLDEKKLKKRAKDFSIEIIGPKYEDIIRKINLDKVQYYIEKNTISNAEKINLDLLKKLNIVNKNSKKLKILGSGEIKNKVIIEANFFSKSAKDKLEKKGGTAQILKK